MLLFERQKALLALVERLGGRVSNTDLQKLLFLWCEKLPPSERPYHFVPYRYGAFSFTSYSDRAKLVKREYFADVDGQWVITLAGRDAVGKHKAMVNRVDSFLSDAPTVRGDALVALTYREYPFFATRSEIAHRVLRDDPAAHNAIESARPPSGVPGIVTIGYEGRSMEEYLVALMRDGVTVLCDVRKNAISRRYGFAKSTLARGCGNVGIKYHHLRELGIESALRKGLETQADYDSLFADYERETLPQQEKALRTISEWVEAGERVALTCYERLPHQCHRHCVADALKQQFGADYAASHL